MRDGIAFGSECAEQHDRGTAQRELDEPDRGGRGQRLQQLDDRRHDVHGKTNGQRHAQQLPRYISPEFQRIEW